MITSFHKITYLLRQISSVNPVIIPTDVDFSKAAELLHRDQVPNEFLSTPKSLEYLVMILT